MSRIFLSDEGYWCDRTKPVAEDGGIAHEPFDHFEECNPEEVVDELEAKLTTAMKFTRHRYRCSWWHKNPCDCGWAEAKQEIVL